MSANQNRHPEPNVWTPGCALGCAAAALVLGGLAAFAGWGMARLLRAGEPGGSLAATLALLLVGVPLVLLGLRGAWRALRAWGTPVEVLERRLAAARANSLLRDDLIPFPRARTTPGTTLTVRLPRHPPGDRMRWGCVLLVGAIPVAATVAAFFAGDRVLVPAFFGLPLVGIALWGLYRGWRPVNTTVELEGEPLCPGEDTRAWICQAGPLRAATFTIHLVCEEVVLVFREDGTARETWSESGDVATAQPHPVLELELFRESGLRLWPGEKRAYSVDVKIPPDAMHTFDGCGNWVRWSIVVAASPEKPLSGCRQLFRREFELRVLPHRAREALLAGTLREPR